MARILTLSGEKEIVKEFERIGVHSGGIKIMKSKAQTILILMTVDNRAANILKQEMLSAGGEVALSKEAYQLDRAQTEIIIIGTFKQYRRLTKKLQIQAPFKLHEAGDQINLAITNFYKSLKREIGAKTFDFSQRAYMMGILNVTPDSFSDGGEYFDTDTAVRHALQMVEDGADIIDIGGESTRPGSEPVPVDVEIKRVVPVINAVAKEVDAPISVDTSKPEVAKEAVEAGAAMVNDVTGLRNEEMVNFVAGKNIPSVIMHMLGEPRTMQENPEYRDVVSDVYDYLDGQAQKVIEAGLDPENVYIDAGIGFGKTLENNLELIKRMSEFKSLGYPIVFGPSRKSFIGNILDLPAGERVEGTAASVALGIANGALIIRVHDVKEMKRIATVTERILRA